MNLTKFAAIVGLHLILPAAAQAWDAEGHMIVAQIAYGHLRPDVKAKCDALIALPALDSSSINSNFITSACWADDIKSFTSAYSIWHYIDLPLSLDGTSTNGIGAAAFDVVQALRQNISVLQATNSAPTNQAMNLRFLIHFAGDIQQPLHASTGVSAAHPTGDGGGNSFDIGGGWGELHYLWDQGGGYLGDSISRPLVAAGQTLLSNKVAAIEALYPYNGGSSIIPDPMDWAQESWGYAKTVAYVGITENGTPSTSYINTVIASTEQRMAAGGHRLADLLNNLLGTPVPAYLTNVTRSASGMLQFAFTNYPGTSFSVLATTNVALPLTAWTNLGAPIEFPAGSGQFQFSDPQATNSASRFYRIAMP